MPFKKDKDPTSSKTLASAPRSIDSGAVDIFSRGTLRNVPEQRADSNSRSLSKKGPIRVHDGGTDKETIPTAATDIVEREYPDNPYATPESERKSSIREERDNRLLARETVSFRKGHALTYAWLFLFTLTVYFRPYELISGLSGFTSMALILAIFTLLAYLPAQFSTHGALTILNTETKCILFIAFWALITIPFAKDPGMAWKEYSETFIKVVIIFVIMVNVLRTRAQISGLMWLGVGVAVLLSIQALILYRDGKFEVEGYRVEVDFGGMFGNPNDMALHLVMFAPIAFAIALGAKSRIVSIIFYGAAAVMILGNFVTQSRGGFLGLVTVALVLIWKLGKGRRLKVLLVSSFLTILFLSLAPGNYGNRMISIFVPSMDPVGSADQRRNLLEQSLLVTLRNPAGIGMGNFRIVGDRNLVTHNSYTQISTELGWLAFIAYLAFLISPLRKLAAVSRRLIVNRDHSWIYYLSIGLQASIAGYMVSSFFVSVAYQWYVYYPVAFAVCLRRIYRLESEKLESNLVEEGI